MIVLDSITSYTFEAETNDVIENNEFYNLVIYVNNNTEEIFNSYFLEYVPSEEWLIDTLLPFSGSVTLITNDFFDTSGILQSRSDTYTCVTGVNTNWECSYGNDHDPWTGPPQCVATEFNYWLTLEYGICVESTPIDIPPGGGFGNGSGGGVGDGYGNVNDNDDGNEILTSTTGGGRRNNNTDECMQSDETFNYFYSLNSPFTVDLSEVRPPCDDDSIDTSEVETNEKFMCLYGKLVESPKFKDLFLNIFGDSEDFNVKFTIVNNLGSNGKCVTTSGHTDPTTGEIIDLNLELQIDKNYLNNASAIGVAKTILHESIHAYLTFKYYSCNQSAPFGIMDDVELSELLNEYHAECAPLEADHEFMFNFMVPTMAEILANLKDDLIPQNHQEAAEDYMFINELNPSTNPDTGEYINDVPWNWDEFFKYLSLAGLQNSSAFHFQIGVFNTEEDIAQGIDNESVKVKNFKKYAITVGINSFKKECDD